MLWGYVLSMVKAQSSIEVSNAPIRSLQPGTSLDVEAYVENGSLIGVGYRVETTADLEGVWSGDITITDSSGEVVAAQEITGFVDGFDDPPFTEGVEQFDLSGASGGDLEVEVRFDTPETISATAEVDGFDPGEDPSLGRAGAAALLGIGALGVGAVALRRRGGD